VRLCSHGAPVGTLDQGQCVNFAADLAPATAECQRG
jgi:hypothetical protein